MTESLGSNPFATRYTRPGAVEFLFPPGQSADVLVANLRTQGWWGAVLGPHGAGKSTLLHTLQAALAQAGRRPVLYTLSRRQRTLPLNAAVAAGWDLATQVIVDGYEQLGWWGRWRLKSLCRRKGAGLLVTAHSPVGIAELYRVEPSLATAQQVVEHLLEQLPEHSARVLASPAAEPAKSNPAAAAGVIHPDDVAAAFARQHGNVRETLFELHDLYRRRIAAPFCD